MVIILNSGRIGLQNCQSQACAWLNTLCTFRSGYKLVAAYKPLECVSREMRKLAFCISHKSQKNQHSPIVTSFGWLFCDMIKIYSKYKLFNILHYEFLSISN